MNKLGGAGGDVKKDTSGTAGVNADGTGMYPSGGAAGAQQQMGQSNRAAAMAKQ